MSNPLKRRFVVLTGAGMSAGGNFPVLTEVADSRNPRCWQSSLKESAA